MEEIGKTGFTLVAQQGIAFAVMALAIIFLTTAVIYLSRQKDALALQKDQALKEYMQAQIAMADKYSSSMMTQNTTTSQLINAVAILTEKVNDLIRDQRRT